MMNTKLVIIYSTAFGLYIISILVFYTLSAVWMIFPLKTNIKNIIYIDLFTYACSFLAQILLSVILWQFSYKETNESNRKDDYGAEANEVEEFDQHTEY